LYYGLKQLIPVPEFKEGLIIAYHKKEQTYAKKPQAQRFLLRKHPFYKNIIHNPYKTNTSSIPALLSF